MAFFSRLFVSAISVFVAFSGYSLAAPVVNETHQLKVGWNAIWMETTPVDSEGELITSDDFFAAYPSVTFVASSSHPTASAEFVSNVGETSFNTEEWLTWRSADSTGGNTLGLVMGGRAYLLYSDGAAPLINFEGTASFNRPIWKPGAYNLRGFRTANLTFGELFAGVTDIFPPSEIFTLGTDGNWVSLTQGSATPVESGIAYWIKCEAATSYMGPIALDVGKGGDVDFGNGSGSSNVTIPANGNQVLSCTLKEIQLENVSSSAQSASFTRVDSASEFQIYQIALSSTELKWEGVSIPPDGGEASFSSMGAGEVDQFKMAAYRAWTVAPTTRYALFEVDLAGVKYYLPLEAATNAVSISPDGGAQSDTYTGLWVGEVVYNGVSSLTEAGQPVSDTTSNAVMPIILHVDDSGTVNLLSAVVLMQTKATAADDDTEMVLVINNERLPYFDGIQERNGKLAGMRFQSVGYDMPRLTDTTTQSLLQQEVFDLDGGANYTDVSEVTEADLNEFLATQSIRPSTLEETYAVKWPMNGTLGSGGSLQTASPLTLDPFHRSNPYRHAYHSKHLAGYQISRVISMSFNTTDSADLLTGFYQEQVSGLTQSDASVAAGVQNADKTITAQGTLTLKRVSTIGSLEQ